LANVRKLLFSLISRAIPAHHAKRHAALKMPQIRTAEEIASTVPWLATDAPRIYQWRSHHYG
jgi:hypothetical protein